VIFMQSIFPLPLYSPSAKTKHELNEINLLVKRVDKSIRIEFPRILIVLGIVKNFPVDKASVISGIMGSGTVSGRDRTRCWKESWRRRGCDDPRRRRRRKLHERTLGFFGDLLDMFSGWQTVT